jgi:hypothetical protein
MTNKILVSKFLILTFSSVIIAAVSFTGCALFILDPADNAMLTISAAEQFSSRGFYGDTADVDWIDVYIYRDPENAGETAEAGTSTDVLVKTLTLNGENGWKAEAPEIPTMTDLRIEAYAYGDTSVHNYDAIDWNVTDSDLEIEDDADARGITMFTGTTSKYISSSTASIYLVMRPYNDGSLQRLPRINGMTSNLNKGELRIDFNDYGIVEWTDGSSSYEKWYWRIIENSGLIADSSFIYNSSLPESALTFNAATTQLNQSEDHDVALEYLFPDDDGDGVVEWFNRVYWLEIANPQHNVLRQAFVMNPGADTFFDVNFAPWIRNITAERADNSNIEFGDNDEVVWSADVVDDNEAEAVRYLWILNLDDCNYWAVYGDLADTGLPTASDYNNWTEWVGGMTDKLGGSLDSQSRTELSAELLRVVDGLDSTGEGLTSGLGVHSDTSAAYPETNLAPSSFGAMGSLFDTEGLSGELYLLVFDGEFEAGATDNLNGYDDYSWSYVRMVIDENSFNSGVITFE